jgi:protease IV
MGSADASGGYYISAPGTYVYANPMTITGSIGIFYGKLDIAGLLGKIGVNVETLKTTERADAQSVFRPFTDDEREVLSGKIEQFYSLFLSRVADGRKMTKADVDKVAQGRVWTGRQAKEHKLVDALGGLRQALAKARVMGGLRDDAPIIELPVRQTSLLGKLLGVEGLKAELSSQGPPLPKQMLDVARAVAPYALFPSTQPLARVEYLPQLLP